MSRLVAGLPIDVLCYCLIGGAAAWVGIGAMALRAAGVVETMSPVFEIAGAIYLACFLTTQLRMEIEKRVLLFDLNGGRRVPDDPTEILDDRD